MIPVLWLSGPPGVGKTAVGWEIYQRLQVAGAKPAYVDVDQLGICYPPLAGDPDRHALKARNVAALRANFAAAGARTLIVSGVVDALRGPDSGTLGGPRRADPDELRARLLQRDGPSDEHEAAVEAARALDHSGFADVCIDTSGVSIGEAATCVLAETGAWPPAGTQRPPSPAPGDRTEAGGEILAVTGATGVGKSAIAFRAYLDVLSSGQCAAYVDVGQIGFCSTAPDDHALKARNLAALWANFHDAGAGRAIVVGRVATRAEARLYEQALPRASWSWRRLRVGEAELTRRILSRGDGGAWAEPGDPLKGRSRDELLAVAGGALTEGRLHDVGLPVDVDGLDIPAAAAALLARGPA
jgi:hypothetical protein